MSRRTREQAILEIIENALVSSQAQLVERLRERGIAGTQATVSRDIKRLGLIKRPAREGGYRYASPGSAVGRDHRGQRQLRAACEQFLTKIDQGDALLVLKTLVGRANALAVAIDECGIPEVVSTLAGDDTILVVTRRVEDRAKLRALLEGMVA